ncbi:MAG: hypothetical protein K6E49_05025 [Lachnospiraceae bacterium]|nr:hypothetical protein [Lachnospiraceae bacterium]
MSKKIRRMIESIFLVMLCAGIMTGCGKKEEPVAAQPEEAQEYYDEAEPEEIEEVEEYEYVEEEPEEIKEDESKPEEDTKDSGSLSNDEIVELAKKHSGAPVAELDQVMDNGNLFIHLYEDMGDHTATIDWYEIDPKTLKGTNFEGEAVDLSTVSAPTADASAGEGDAGEGVVIADGEYVTDEEYKGELSADGKTMTITTALSEFVNSPSPTYPKQTYVFTVSDSCKCVEMQEDVIESSFFDKKDLISDFLEGLSGLPITLTFKNNELVEIMFSS